MKQVKNKVIEEFIFIKDLNEGDIFYFSPREYSFPYGKQILVKKKMILKNKLQIKYRALKYENIFTKVKKINVDPNVNVKRIRNATRHDHELNILIQE